SCALLSSSSLPPSPTSVSFPFTATSTTYIPSLSLHDALPISSSARLPPQQCSCYRYTHQRPQRGAQLRRPFFRNGRAHDESLHRSEEHTYELQSRFDLVCRLLLEKKNG